MPWRAGWSCAGALLAIAVLIAGAAQAADPPSLEYAVKANYLYKFAPFVDWPDEAGAGGAFTICIAGEDPFGAMLDEAVRGQAVEGRPIVVRRMPAVAPAARQCQVLYVGRIKGQSAADALKAVRSEPVLTVTDEHLGSAGGMVHFVLRDGHVRFAINAQAAQASGLTLSSKLMALSVGGGR